MSLQTSNKLLVIAVVLLSIAYTSAQRVQPKLMEFTSSECLGESVYERRYINRILGVEKKSTYHVYKIFVVTNCSWASSGSVSLKNDTLNLIYSGTPIDRKVETIVKDSTVRIHTTDSVITEIIEIEYEVIEEVLEVAECDCAFELKYKVTGLEDREYTVMANGKSIIKTKHKYKVVNEKPHFEVIKQDTVNLIDIYDLKQGLHIYKNKGKERGRFYFRDNTRISGYSTKYNFEGYDKVEDHMRNERYYLRKYFSEDKLVQECKTEGIFEEGTDCQYFN